MHKLICVVGPTATGKTKKAIELSLQSPSILVSADSRQVYRGMDIVTGKDHPQDIIIHGIDIVGPDEDCSVSIWYDAIMPTINQAWAEGKQVIVVGGTGLYVKALTDGIETMQVPINQSLREELTTLSLQELQSKLSALDNAKYQSMNNSDQNNSRRLVRAIEIASNPQRVTMSQIDPPEIQIIGLRYYHDSNYGSNIRARVLSRLKSGAVEETKILLSKYDPSLKSMSAIGYQSIISFLKNEITESEMIESWVEGELSYAKRQLTWFRKQSVIWYDIDTYGN